MFIAKDKDLIIMINESREQLIEDIKFYKYTSIEETHIDYQLYNSEYLTPEEIAIKERERLDMLYLTGADVERGIYQAKGMDFDDIMAFVMANPPQGLDMKALKIELKANNFYRGNPYVNAVGSLLGFTAEQLDKFFETKDYTYLLPSEQVEDTNVANSI